MAATVYKRASALRDLVEDYIYLAEHAGIETAERFLASADKSFGDLSRHPEMGTALPLREPRLAGLRKWRVDGFEKFLIFYLPRPDGVSIVRVLHAAQDWWGLLGIL
ncbi:MAG TPA: type II toxin-antitoxin system RelE/ParE family toxin [Bryobacteraceae bacterium]|jgi:toxin ParE1/3/4|nr:type II toxin-antitoxin system RelE/ParE family toxin [Bryobacteraceae bacterium]